MIGDYHLTSMEDQHHGVCCRGIVTASDATVGVRHHISLYSSLKSRPPNVDGAKLK